MNFRAQFARLSVGLLPALGQGAQQSSLDPQTPTATAIADIAWLMFGGAAVIFALVMALAAWSVVRPGRASGWLANQRAIVVGGIAFPVVLLTALLVHTLRVAGEIVSPAAAPALRIEVMGEQFWWRVNYLNEAGHIDVPTANEIHLPVGREAELRLRTADVIHSFWVPNLAGKIDMIPGRVTTLRLYPERQGVWRGQCAEYCGAQHANMALLVVAEPPEAFEAWLAHQRRSAATPATPPP
ncbi:cytochrome c oxidase subunit II [Methylomagnum sp.]